MDKAGEAQQTERKRTMARTGNMTQFLAQGKQEERDHDWDTVSPQTQTYTHTYINTHKHTYIHKHSLALARGLERTVLFLKHPGGCGGSNRVPTEISLPLSYSFFVHVFLTLCLPLCFFSPFGSSQSLNTQKTRTHSHQQSVWHWQLLPDRLTVVSPPRHQPCRGGLDWPVSFSLPSSTVGPSLSSGAWQAIECLTWPFHNKFLQEVMN